MEEAGDPYRDQMEDCIYLIMQELKARGVNNDHTLAYQVGRTILDEFPIVKFVTEMKSRLIVLDNETRCRLILTISSEPSRTSAVVEALY